LTPSENNTLPFAPFNVGFATTEFRWKAVLLGEPETPSTHTREFPTPPGCVAQNSRSALSVLNEFPAFFTVAPSEDFIATEPATKSMAKPRPPTVFAVPCDSTQTSFLLVMLPHQQAVIGCVPDARATVAAVIVVVVSCNALMGSPVAARQFKPEGQTGVSIVVGVSTYAKVTSLPGTDKPSPPRHQLPAPPTTAVFQLGTSAARASQSAVLWWLMMGIPAPDAGRNSK
jgi:hypothetical protein